jgi:hypothetical protein
MGVLGFLQRLVGGSPEPTPPAEAPKVHAASEAIDALDVAEQAHAKATSDLAAITLEHDEASEALGAAERAYVADPSDATAIRAAKERYELVDLRHAAAVEKEAKTSAAVATAKATLEAEFRALRVADAMKRADLADFRARQASRSARMVALRDELRTLAAESDADFFAVNDASKEAGIEPLDELHLIADLFGELPFDVVDVVRALRLNVRVDDDARTGLTALVEPLHFRTPNGMTDCDQERAKSHLEIVRQHRTFTHGRIALEEKLRAEQRSAAEALAQDPAEIARRQAWGFKQAQLAEQGRNADPFAGYR